MDNLAQSAPSVSDKTICAGNPGNFTISQKKISRKIENHKISLQKITRKSGNFYNFLGHLHANIYWDIIRRNILNAKMRLKMSDWNVDLETKTEIISTNTILEY